MIRLLLLCLCLPFFAFSHEMPLPSFLQSYVLSEEATPSEALNNLLTILDIHHENTLSSIVSSTQKAWIQTGKERWEFAPLSEDRKEELLPLFKDLGLCDEIAPSRTEYDYALIHGGFYSRVIKRVEHLIAQFEQGVRFSQVVLLTGQRFLDPNTSEKDLPFQTETEMMLYVWESTPMPEEMRALPVRLVDAPRHLNAAGQSVRPSTIDTLNTWLETNPVPGSCLFISSQPFCGYQDSVVRSCLPTIFEIETIGVQSPEKTTVAVYLDNLARWLYQENIRRNR